MEIPKELLSQLMDNPLLWAKAFLRTPGSGEPFKPTHVERLILEAKSQRIVIRVPRRRGKTFGVAIRMLHRLCTRENFEIIVTGPQDIHVNSILDLIQDFLECSPLLSGVVWNPVSKDYRGIEFPESKNKIMGLTSGQSTARPGMKLRGQGAHMIFADEAAYLIPKVWEAIDPIFDGNQFYQNVEVILASTPTHEHGRYYDYCMAGQREGGLWEEIHKPITELDDTDLTPEKLAQMQANATSIGWIVEQLALFPNMAENAYGMHFIERAKQGYDYVQEKPATGYITSMGVDWDKYQAGVNIVVVVFHPGLNEIRVLYREEVPRSEYSLNAGVKRVIELNEIFDPKFILVDRGYGEKNVEDLKLHGLANPETRLAEKIEGVMFKQNVKIMDPITMKERTISFKTDMINILMRLLENGQLKFAMSDKLLATQLEDYKIIGSSGNDIKTSKRNEHIHDALGLACYPLYRDFMETKAPSAPLQIVTAPKPEFKRSIQYVKAQDAEFSPFRGAMSEPGIYGGLGRGLLGQKLPKRQRI